MTRQCLFCPNPVDSAEHIWSDWIIQDLKMATSIRQTIGRKSVWLDNPKIKVECVCRTCNNGWMSRLEESNRFPIRAMIHGEPCHLSKKDQAKLTRWALLKAVVVDAVNQNRAPFYLPEEKEHIKSGTPISVGNLAWLGHFSHKGFHVGGTDIWRQVDEVPKAIQANVTTLIMGHLVIQTLTGHIFPQFAQRAHTLYCQDGAWNVRLLDIWPTTTAVRWPPDFCFTLRGTDGIATVLNRWKLGDNIG